MSGKVHPNAPAGRYSPAVQQDHPGGRGGPLVAVAACRAGRLAPPEVAPTAIG
jgi:hypothetical protein